MSLYRRLASQSTLIFGARLGGAGLIFVVQAMIARFWGAEILGEYLVIIATVNLVAVVMPLGFQTIGTYFAAEYRARQDRRQLRAFLMRAYGHAVGMFAALVILGHPLLDLLGQGASTLALHFVPACLLAFGTTMVFINGAVLVGLKRPLAGFLADTIFRPMVVIAAFAGASIFLSSPDTAFTVMLWVVGIGYAVISIVHFGFVVSAARSIGQASSLDDPQHVRRWWRFALPWVLISLATDFFFDIDLLILSAHMPREELAVFGICTRIFSLISFGVAAVYAVIMPDMFESEASDDRAGFHRKVGEANLVAGALSALLFIGMSLLGPFALRLFGPEFAAGAMPLSVLCLALLVRSLMGPASVVLSIHDRPWSSIPAVFLGLATLFVANLLLVPPYGLMGAAVAALIAISLWSISLWYVALRTARVDVSIFAWLRRPHTVPAE
ncbi:polysaccharide biosynthesis protein [Devosia pacifica]|uniref:Polysaccharide biosynthesis protein n=1 Tax=Devosia pacifica TaxID=1335967 RepID=A0A918VPM5_9HYPH|nr:lipopolysaccharide biosynthesis protein [Devosia pacifica]GHA14978.1 polysaccharide biosynthesis protein [Devosia pacifica]